jgi:uncharacterized protein YqeY
MELLERIKEDRTAARKGTSAVDKIRATLLTTLVGEAETALKGKQAKKFDMLALVKKFQSNCHETLAIKFDEKIHIEICLLQEYIPEQLTEIELCEKLVESGASNIGQFMGYLNKSYKGLFDGKLAAKVAKTNL